METNEKAKMMYIHAALPGANGKRIWVRWGVAFENKDKSINLKPNILPRGDVPLVVTDTKEPPAKLAPSLAAEPWRILAIVKVKGRDKGIWIQCGTAIRTKDGYRLNLDGFPIGADPTLQLRPPRSAEQAHGADDEAPVAQTPEPAAADVAF